MNLVLLFDEDFIDSARVRLSGRRLRHVESVLRVSEGESIRVGRLGGPTGVGTVRRIGGGEVVLDLELDDPPPLPSQVTLLLALPRPKVLSRVLSTITAMGVKTIVLFDCWRVEKSFWGSPRLDPRRIEKALLEGLEQARDTILPSVRIERRFTPFVEDELPSLVEGKRAVVAHPRASNRLSRSEGEVVAAIGPEGGFIPNEVEMLERAGLEPVCLGPRILHVEAAVPALLAKLD